MQIETVKWQWAENVKRKEIYRDDEFVRTKTKEEALEANDFLLKQPKGLTYTITVFRDGEYFTYYRHSQPCLGSLVKYRDAHGEKYDRNPYFPRDIYVAFPEGDITFIGMYREDAGEMLADPYYNFILGPESPWISAFNDVNSIIIKDNHFILTDMNADPTVFYSIMRLGGLYGSYYYRNSQLKNWNPKAEILFQCCHSACQADPRRLAGQKPIKTSGGMWSDSWGYVRPYNESIFKTSIPCKFENFKNLPTNKYPPQNPQSQEYFLSVMKEKFGIEKPEVNQQTQDALVLAWDFFKEESKNLDDGFPK